MAEGFTAEDVRTKSPMSLRSGFALGTRFQFQTPKPKSQKASSQGRVFIGLPSCKVSGCLPNHMQHPSWELAVSSAELELRAFWAHFRGTRVEKLIVLATALHDLKPLTHKLQGHIR